MNKILILDFGSQYTHLIATRIRRLGVYSEIVDPSVDLDTLKTASAVILSGGPASVYEEGAPTVDPRLFELGKPVLGICYGHQLITHLLGGRVEPGKGQGAEFGKASITIKKNAGLLSSFQVGEESTVWMSHGDRVTALPEGFEVLAESKDDGYSAVGDLSRNFFGIQFHTEVLHSVRGAEMLANFIDLAGIQRDWNLGDFVESSAAAIRAQIGDKKVFMLISGGVDSTVAYVLLSKALGEDRVYGLFVDTGFMRKGEREQVEAALRAEGIHNLHVEEAGEAFFAALAGVIDPEKKREIIGRVFLEVQARVSRELNLNPEEWVLGQGTIYPDTIESGGTKNASKIKTHHNRVPEIEALIRQGRVIEPLKDLYKDEVREVGARLGLPAHLVERHPFPGPGLAVRLLCATAEDWVENRVQTEAEINQFLEEKRKEGLLSTTLRARTLPIKSVGVQGDFRTYSHPVVLESNDPKTVKWKEMAVLAPALTNRFRQINRVLFQLRSEQVSDDQMLTVSPSTLTPARVHRLQEVDHLAMTWLKALAHTETALSTDDVTADAALAARSVWQMPTVLIPVGTAKHPESIVLRPIVSEEAMTAHFAELPMDACLRLADQMLDADENLYAVYYDVTNKPPATIEWE